MRKLALITIGMIWGISIFFMAFELANLIDIGLYARPAIAGRIFWVSLIFGILYFYFTRIRKNKHPSQPQERDEQ